MINDTTARKTIVDIGLRMYKHGFVAATDGNISIRLDEDNILTTPSGMSKGMLHEDDLIVIDFSGKVVSGYRKPSSEYRLHTTIYEARPDVNAVIHAHPPLCTALTVAGISMDEPILPEVVLTLGSIPTASYATPTTDEVPKSIKGLIPSHDAILLERHGTVTVGECCESAYHKLEKLEHTAQVMLLALQIGSANPLSSEQINKLVKLRELYSNK